MPSSIQKMLNKKKGILFWLTGLSGSGKTSIAKLLLKEISNHYGPTIVVSGDDIRNSFGLNEYSKISREKLGIMYTNFFKIILDQKINIIFAGVVLLDSVRLYNRKSISNYFEIYLKSDINKLKKRKKKIYKLKKNVVGVDIVPEFPKNPDIVIINDFTITKKEIAQLIFKKILRKITSYYLIMNENI